MSDTQSTLYRQRTAELQRAIRTAQHSDLANIVVIHQRAFTGSFLTNLGSGFLRHYYELVLDYPGKVLLISAAQEQMEGFVCGFLEPDGFYRSMSQRSWRFALPVLGAVARDPRLSGKILNGFRRVGRNREATTAESCELSSLAVLPESRRKGAGAALLRAFLDHAARSGAQQVFLRTDADDNESVNRMYRNASFQIRRRYRQYKDRWMNEYVTDLSAGGAGNE